MSWRRQLAKFSALFRRPKPEAELAEEIRAHLVMEEQENLEAGMTPEEAHYAALRSFRNVTLVQESSREMWVWNWVDTLRQDVRYALRTARRNPGFAAIAVLTLALGIGANTAIFSVVDGVMLRPLPYRDADRLVTIASNVSGVPGASAGSSIALSYPDYQDIGKLADAVAGIAAYSSDRYNLSHTDPPREVQVTRTTADLFPVLGVSPVIGRAFNASEAHHPFAIISHALWTASFGSDMSVLGRTISLDAKSFTIVGVMPAGFAFPDATTDVWIPIGWALADAAAMAEMRTYRAFSTVARLAPDASLDRLRGDLDLLGKRITASDQPTSKFGSGETFTANLLRDEIVGDARQPLLILLGAASAGFICSASATAYLSPMRWREKRHRCRRVSATSRASFRWTAT